MSPLLISVIICTHNPRPDYLRRVLDALKAQTLPKEHWELLLVDNASQEPLAKTWDLSWHPQARHVREEELGLSFARLRGLSEAVADLVVFFDDDNVSDSTYLSETLKIGNAWPQLGVWGGSIVPEFELAPPEYLAPYLKFLALREVNVARWSNVSTCDTSEPWGAGFCVRKVVAEAYREYYKTSKLQLTGRQGSSLISGEDTEICMIACGLGVGMGLFPELKLVHLIPKHRVAEDYLVKINEGIQISRCLLAFKWHGRMPAPVSGLIPALRHIRQFFCGSRINWRMYWAEVRARRKALRIIAASMN